jgi:hypothetical protein
LDGDWIINCTEEAIKTAKHFAKMLKPYYWHKSNATRERNMMAFWMPEYMLDGNKLNGLKTPNCTQV